MDKKGQISVEVILFLALVLLIVLAVASYIYTQNYQNNILTATRLGAENATTGLGMKNLTMIPVRVEGIEMTGTENVTILIHLSNNNNQIQNATLTSVYNSLISQGYSPTKNLPNYIQNLTMNTTTYGKTTNYLIKLA
jgi:uncharacterized protein (UPF0333 family)